MSERIISFGLRNVCYAVANKQNDAISYQNVKKIRGSQEISMELIGGSNHVYADDCLKASFNQNAGKTVSLTMTVVPDEVKIDLLGYNYDENNNLVENALAEPIYFALGFEIQGDREARRVWYLLCTAQPFNFSTKSKTDSVEANSVPLAISVYPVPIGNYEMIQVVGYKSHSNYDTFFDAVPTIETEYDIVKKYDPSNSKNDGFVLHGNDTSVSGHTKDGVVVTRGYKVSASQVLDFETSPNADSVTLKVSAFSNSTSSTTRLAVMDRATSGVTYSTGYYDLKSVEPISTLTVSLLPNKSYSLVKGDAEYMVCYVELIEHFKV